MVSWRYPDTTKRVRVAFVCPTGSDPALSVVGTFCPITPDVMITQCSAAYFLAWVRRNFTRETAGVPQGRAPHRLARGRPLESRPYRPCPPAAGGGRGGPGVGRPAIPRGGARSRGV